MIPGLTDMNSHTRQIVAHSYIFGGKEVVFESGNLALSATGSVVIRDTLGNFLLTTCGIGNPKDGDFFPLTVEYQEKFYASGKIGGNRFSKREGRPSDNAVINARIIDRPIRPMFPKNTRTDVQIIASILSSSGLSDFGWYGVTGASLSLLLAGTQEFEGPVSAVRVVADTAGNCIFDPTFEQIQNAHLDLIVAGTIDAITMVESQGKEVHNDIVVQAFHFAHTIVREMCEAQLDFIKGYREIHEIIPTPLTIVDPPKSLEETIGKKITPANVEALYGLGKMQFHDAIQQLFFQVKLDLATDWCKETSQEIPASIDTIPDGLPFSDADIADIIKDIVKNHMRASVLNTGSRLDGRKKENVRPVQASAAILPRAHGSALFERGITQVLSVATLGGPEDIQIVDDMLEEGTKRYIHHYNFPPFSVGEVRPLRGVGRREIGHGRLAEKALEPVLPTADKFPYMMRVVSETLTCNGSSSMASICGSSLALMDAGVPISNIVAGVAMGMIYETPDNYAILADIQAQEDFLGDMDFKIARTEIGVTALQMDCKIAGLSLDVVANVLDQAKDAIGYILEQMRKCLDAPRSTLSPYAPFLVFLQVPEEKMREVIGKGGETIQGIEKEFDVKVSLEDDGGCTITAKDQISGEKAQQFIKQILKDIELGDVYDGKIIKILDMVGAIVEIGKGKEGMIHISKFGNKERINNVHDVVRVGEIVKVKVYNIDREKGRIGLERITS